MAEAFKNRIDADLIGAIAKHLVRVSGEFPRARFVKRANAGLAALELKGRVAHVADALAHCLPTNFGEAVTVLERSLAPERFDADLAKLVTSEDGLAGWAVWPMTDYIARHGLAHPKRALQALHALTKRNTAEYAIRSFLAAHRDLTMATFRKWVDDSSPHVRRLVSEGSRPRLPWGMQLTHLVEDPTPTFPFLAQLQGDSSGYVRRSVANHLNDISKDHPGRVAEWLELYLPTADKQLRALLRHASRTLIKRCDRRVLAAWGMAAKLRGSAAFVIEPSKVHVGETVNLLVELRSLGKSVQSLMVDYVVHHVRSRGGTSAKTWKGWQVKLEVDEHRCLSKRHSLRPVTTRRDYPGLHQVDIVVNGQVVASAAFELVA